MCWLRGMPSKKINRKAPTNGFDTTTIDDRLKNVSRFTWYALNPPEKNLSPLNKPFSPKIAIGPNPPLTEEFQKSPILKNL